MERYRGYGTHGARATPQAGGWVFTLEQAAHCAPPLIESLLREPYLAIATFMLWNSHFFQADSTALGYCGLPRLPL